MQDKATSSRLGRTKKADRTGLRKQILPLLLLVFVTLAAYLNAWPDSLTLDDKAFAAGERFTGLSLSDTSLFFTEDLWEASGGTTGLYRPLLLITIAMDAYVYGDWAAGYHLTNILLHLLVTLLVFGFIRHLLRARSGQNPLSDRIALLAAMVFGVHPIHTEVVNSIFNRSGMLVSLGVVGGLWWFLRAQETSPRKARGGLAAIYLLILFCKESAAILPPLAVAMLWLFTPGNWRVQLRKSLPVLWLLIPLGIYLGLRANALDVPGISNAAGTPEIIQMPSSLHPGEYTFWERLLKANSVWFESLKIVVWPHPLQIYHPVLSVNTWLALALQLALAGLAIMGFMQKRYGLIAGLAFFYIAMLPASRIIGALGGVPNLAERYIYLPSVGLAIALAFGLKWLTQRFNLRAALAPVILALVILTPITWARNADWASDVLLFESDYRQGNRQEPILHLLVGAHLEEKNYSRATEICDRHANTLETAAQFSQRCGLAYGQLGRFDDAEQSFFLAMNDQRMVAMTHTNLASMYLHLGRRSDAQKHFELAVETESNPALIEYRKAYMLIKLHPSDRAKLLEAQSFLKQALQIQPQLVSARQSLERLNKTLGNG